MADLKSGVLLDEDEKLVLELEAELWATSSNPVARFFGNVKKTISKVFGTSKKGFIVITNKRVIEVSNLIECYCFNTAHEVKYVMPSSVKEVGYSKLSTCGFCCPAYYVYYESFTQRTSILLKGVDEAGTKKIVDTLYASLTGAALRAE